jgi:hypothetical protein
MVSYMLLICSTSGKGGCEGKVHMTICQKEKKSDVCVYAAIEEIKIWTRILNWQSQLVASIYKC